MKKFQLLIILLLILALLGLADYAVTKPDLSLSKAGSEIPASPEFQAEGSSMVKEKLEAHPEWENYLLQKTIRTSNLFDDFDLSESNIIAHKHDLSSSTAPFSSLVVYELKAPQNQGADAFQRLKTKITSEMDPKSDLNVNNQYGQNSFYYNNANAPETAFLLIQSGDTMVGFVYAKNSLESASFVKKFAQSL